MTHSYDAFMRGQEIVSGAQRIHDPEMLVERMKSMDPPLNPDSEGFRHYVDAFRMGCAWRRRVRAESDHHVVARAGEY